LSKKLVSAGQLAQCLAQGWTVNRVANCVKMSVPLPFPGEPGNEYEGRTRTLVEDLKGRYRNGRNE